MQLEHHTDPCGSDPTMRFSSSRQWPGERHPTRWDVHDANESPATTFLDHFRAALLHSEGAEEDALLDSDTVIDSSEGLNSVRCPDVLAWPPRLMSRIARCPQIHLSDGASLERATNTT